MMKTILCFAAHPDDLEFSCIGTLKKMSDNGFHLIYVIITNGENGFKLANKNKVERIKIRITTAPKKHCQNLREFVFSERVSYSTHGQGNRPLPARKHHHVRKGITHTSTGDAEQ